MAGFDQVLVGARIQSRDAVLAEIEGKLKAGLKADFITLGGSGEPTLNSRLGELIDGTATDPDGGLSRRPSPAAGSVRRSGRS